MPQFLLLPALALFTLLALACSGGDDSEDAVPAGTPTVPGTIVTASTPTPTPTLGTAPETTATPTPELSPEEQVESLSLVDAPQGLLQFTTDGPYVVPGDALGVFYLNIETQAFAGWFDLVGDTAPVAFSGDNRFTLFQRSEQAFVGGQSYPAGYYLGDRETRGLYRWSGEAEPVYQKTGFNAREIAALGDLVLLRVPDEDGEDWFALLNIETNEVASTFQAEAEWALISDDASRIALVADEISVHDVESGETETILDNAGEIDIEGTVEMISTGTGFLLVTSPAKPGFTGGALHYAWDGKQLSELTGARLYASADGSHIAVAEPLGGGEDGRTPWFVFSVYDTASGAEQFRVSGVTTEYAFKAGDRLLADGSGIAVSRADGELVLAMNDGSLRSFPGVPSPTDVGVFAVTSSSSTVGTVGAVDDTGEPLVAISIQGGVRDFVDPWGDSGDEVRFLIPHLGHDGGPVTATIVEPYVQQAPFDGPPPVQLGEVAVAFGLLNLYDAPASENIVGQVMAPHRVTVEEVRLLCHGDGYSDAQDCPRSESMLAHEFMALVSGAQYDDRVPVTSYWARVTTPDGQEGWLLLQANIQGI